MGPNNSVAVATLDWSDPSVEISDNIAITSGREESECPNKEAEFEVVTGKDEIIGSTISYELVDLGFMLAIP